MKLALLIAVLLATTALADPPNDQAKRVEIPLDRIWGYNLPGTRDIAGLPLPEERPIQVTDATLRRQRENLIELVRSRLASQPPTVIAASGFVIPRQPDLEALSRFRIPDHPKTRLFARSSYPEGTDLTLAFFSYPSGYYVRLRKVERQGNQITVYYQFEPHKKPEVTVHFAMIPLGKLPAGDYRVTYERIPMEREYLDAGFEPGNDAVVCRGFAFKVFERPTDEPPIEGTTLIPLHQIWGYRMPGPRNVSELDVVTLPDGTTVHPMIRNLQRVMAEKTRNRETAGSAFVVVGTDKEALENAHAVLTDKVEPERYFSSDTDLTLVFYSHMVSHSVHVASVERLEQRIIVKYRFMIHGRGSSSSYFALIPLGQLPAGDYEVEIRQVSPVDVNYRPSQFFPDPGGIVCQDFSFEVGGP